MGKLTNTKRIDKIENTCSSLEEKMDKLIDLVASRGEVVKEPVYSATNKTDTAKAVSGQFRPMTVDQAIRPAKSEPMLMGKVPMDNSGNLTDKSWKRVSCEDGSEKYIKYRPLRQLPNGELELSDEIEDETETFYVDQNRKKLSEWRKSRGDIYNKQISLSKKFQTEAI